MDVELVEGEELEVFFLLPGLFLPGRGVMEMLGELFLVPPF